MYLLCVNKVVVGAVAGNLIWKDAAREEGVCLWNKVSTTLDHAVTRFPVSRNELISIERMCLLDTGLKQLRKY